LVEVGEILGDGGDAIRLPLVVELVVGRWSDPRLFGSLAWRKALKTDPRAEAMIHPMSVKDAELRPTRVAIVEDAGRWL
jgi:hypothetical protein